MNMRCRSVCLAISCGATSAMKLSTSFSTVITTVRGTFAVEVLQCLGDLRQAVRVDTRRVTVGNVLHFVQEQFADFAGSREHRFALSSHFIARRHSDSVASRMPSMSAMPAQVIPALQNSCKLPCIICASGGFRGGHTLFFAAKMAYRNTNAKNSLIPLKNSFLTTKRKKNSHGFFLLNGGGHFDRFQEYPVMLDNHNLDRLIVGRWDNLHGQGWTYLHWLKDDPQDWRRSRPRTPRSVRAIRKIRN